MFNYAIAQNARRDSSVYVVAAVIAFLFVAAAGIACSVAVHPVLRISGYRICQVIAIIVAILFCVAAYYHIHAEVLDYKSRRLEAIKTVFSAE